MNDKICKEDRLLTGSAALVASVPTDAFGNSVLDFVSKTATFKNASVFYFPDLTHPQPVQSVWSTGIGVYWLRRHGEIIASDPALLQPIVEKVQAAPTVGVRIDRWHADDDHPLAPWFEKFELCERIGVASRSKRFGYKSYFLRATADGWLTDEEYRGLCEILPFVHELIGLRYRIRGSESIQLTTRSSVSSLRVRQVMGFSELSQREAETCDCLVIGMTIAGTALELGIAESTVRTLRQRAYRKLDVTSATQLMARMVRDSEADQTGI